MKEEKVLVFGHVGYGNILAAKTALINIKDKEIVIISPKEETQLPFPKSEPFIIRNNSSYMIPGLNNIYGGFVCKGKHQYREVSTKQKEGDGGILMKSEWICQCGRKTTD